MGLFDRVEHRLERAVNGVFARAFKSEVQPVEIASAIRRAMDDRAAIV
ncbi:MAG: FhaA domain-containing protein, partial [Angustibacter sp.]